MIEATKTEAIMLVGRRRIPELRLEEHSCRTSMHVKYLGIWLSRNGSFMRHVKEQAARASAALNTLTGILANTRGPGQVARKAMDREPHQGAVEEARECAKEGGAAGHWRLPHCVH